MEWFNSALESVGVKSSGSPDSSTPTPATAGSASSKEPEAPFSGMPGYQSLEDDETTSLQFAKPIKYDDAFTEAKDIILENVGDFQEGLTITLQKPIVAPQGTPPPPNGPGPHRNFQATMQQKVTLHNPQTSVAQVSIHTNFSPDDMMMCTYNSQGMSSGLLVRSFGPFDFVAQWMEQMHGTGFFANVDYKMQRGVSSVSYVRNQFLQAQHMHGLWKGFYMGAKMKYDMTSGESSLGYGFRWAAPKRNTVWCGEVSDNGAARLALVRKAPGFADTTFCTQFEYSGSGGQQPHTSRLWVGFMREYLNHMKLRMAVNTLFNIKAVLEVPVGRACHASYNVDYDPHKKNLRHGLVFQMS